MRTKTIIANDIVIVTVIVIDVLIFIVILAVNVITVRRNETSSCSPSPSAMIQSATSDSSPKTKLFTENKVDQIKCQ